MADVAFPVTFRDAEPRDLGFIVGHWLDSRYYGPPSIAVRRGEYKRRERPIIDALVRDGLTIVACDPDSDGEILYGFACGSADALHYVFARQTRRRGGLGTALLHELLARGVVPSVHTYTTRDGSRWWARARGSHEQAA